MPDHPEHAHLALEQDGLLKIEGLGVPLQEESGWLLFGEDGADLTDETSSLTAYLVLEQNEGAGLSRFRQEGEPYSFFLLEDGSGDLLLEEQPRVNIQIG